MNVLVIYKKSKYSFYRVSPEEHVRAFAESDHPRAKRWREGHAIHEQSLEKVLAELSHRNITYDTLHRSKVTDTDKYDLVIAVGGDGTVLDASHHVRSTPLLGVNSSPGRSNGHYCACTAENFGETIDNLDKIPRHLFPRIEACIDGQALPELALNDVLFAHSNIGASISYDIDGVPHLDSGILTCASGGSTAWMKDQGGEIMAIDDPRLQYKEHTYRIPTRYASQLVIESFQREGQVCIDGEHTCYPVSLGQKLELRGGVRPVTIIADLAHAYAPRKNAS